VEKGRVGVYPQDSHGALPQNTEEILTRNLLCNKGKTGEIPVVHGCYESNQVN
jgi:hypothetical protein